MSLRNSRGVAAVAGTKGRDRLDEIVKGRIGGTHSHALSRTAKAFARIGADLNTLKIKSIALDGSEEF